MPKGSVSTESFTIYEPSDCKNLIKTIVRELNLPDEKYKPNLIASRISYAKNCLVTPGAYLANSVYAAEDRQAQIPEVRQYLQYLLPALQAQRCDGLRRPAFADQHPAARRPGRAGALPGAVQIHPGGRVPGHQLRPVRHHPPPVAAPLKVCVVGDDAQSIYSFRGAKIENILSFQKDFPRPRSSSSSRTTARPARSSMRPTRSSSATPGAWRNTASRPATWVNRSAFSRPIPTAREAEMVVSDLRDKVRSTGDDWSEAVILYRTNNQSAVLEDNLPPPRHSPTASTRAVRSTTTRRSRTCWPISGW